jgi:hypothetical protein
MDTRKQIIQQVMEGYAGEGLGGYAYLTANKDKTIFTVIDISTTQGGKHEVYTSLVVRLVGQLIVIEHDDNNKPLVDALLQAGIVRKEIILAYAGEPVPAITS